MANSIERDKFHIILEKFKTYIAKDALVYDLGKSMYHDYKPVFKDFKYKTLDRNEKTNPDIVVNVEEDWGTTLMELADAIICNGVAEQCDDFAKVLEGIDTILKVGGYALFGIISVGYPIYFSEDYVRYTPSGIDKLLKGYEVVFKEIVHRGDIPSYVFIIGRKKEEND